MVNIFHILNRKRLQIFFCFYVLLTLPLLCLMAANLPLVERLLIVLANGLLFLALLVLSLFFTSRVEKVVYSTLFLLSLVPTAILMAYLLFAHVLLRADSIISLFETNTEESKEFLAYYLSPWVILGVLVYISIPIVMIWKMRKFQVLKIKQHKISFFFSLLALVGLLSVPQLSKAVPFIDFYKIYVSYRLRVTYEDNDVATRQKLPYSVQIDPQDSASQTMVVVIGESLSKHHMSIYGYGRNTNPLLMARKSQLYIYSDVVSPQVHTIPVMRSVLTLHDSIHDDPILENPSMFELFNRAGFETSLISNQAFMGRNKTSYNAFLDLAEQRWDLTSMKSDDAVVFKQLRDVLNEKSKKNRFIVVHLMGNHMAYNFRYPSSYKHFDNQKDHFFKTTAYRNLKAIKVMDSYDNSVLYNDFVVDSIIKMIQNRPQSAMVYFSDHGEEVYDKRDFAGHAYEKVTDYMCEIPFIVWLSPHFKLRDMKMNVSRSFSTQDALFSISDLAGLRYKDYDASKSVFSATFRERTRYVGNMTYEQVQHQKYSIKWIP